MRKVLSFVLVLAMILGSVSMAFAAPSDVVGTDSETSVSVLMDLGVVTGYSDGSFKPAGIVTRAEMAAFIIRALGLNPNATSATQFSDVSATHWASKYVVYAASLGIILGRTATVFDPDATVSYDEAVTMLVRALGYTEASLNGTYPAAYVSKAKALGIIGSIQAGTAGANRGDIAQLVYNTLSCEMGKVNAENEWIGSSVNGDLDTMLDRLGAEAYVPAYKADYVSSETNEFLVDGTEDSIINLKPYLGMIVTAKANSDNEIIAIDGTFSTLMNGELNAAADTFTSNGVDYSLDTNAKTDVANGGNVVISESGITALGFENGEIAAAVFATASVEGTLSVKVSGLTVKAVYAVLAWNADDADFFSDSDAVDIEEDHELFNFAFAEDDNGDIDMDSFELVGASSLDAIEEDSVVHVYVNASDEISRVAVGTEVIEGTVTKVNSATTKYTLGGKIYAASALDSGFAAPTAGEEVKFYLDAFGDVYDVDAITSTDNYAILLDGSDGIDRLQAGDALALDLFLADGTDKVFSVDSDSDIAVVSGTAVILTGTAVGLRAYPAGALVQYGLNADGEIDTLEIATTAGGVAKSVTAFGTYNGKVVMDDAVVFTFDTSYAASDADGYTATTKDVVLDSDPLTGTYVLDSNEIECLILYDFSTTVSTYAMFTGWATISTDYDFETYLLVDGVATTYEATATAKADAVAGSVSTGAIYMLKFDASGALSDADTFAVAAAANTSITSKAVTLTAATPTAVSGQYLTDGNAAGPTETIYTLASDVVVYTWDAEEGEWIVGRTRDARGLTTGAITSITLYSTNEDDMDVYDIVVVR